MWKALVATALMLTVAAAGRAAPAGPAWKADWADDSCGLIRGEPAKDGTFLAIRQTPGADSVFIDLANSAWHGSPAKRLDNVVVQIEPGGPVASEAMFVRYPSGSSGLTGPTLILSVKQRAFVDQLAAAKALTIREGGRVIGAFDLPLAARAVRALRTCESDLLRRWGIDPQTWFALRSGPQLQNKLGSLATPDDYPTAALREDASGKVVIRLTVDDTGKAKTCAFLARSGNNALDDQTCAIGLGRARFTPAIGADGNPVAAYYVISLTWSIRG